MSANVPATPVLRLRDLAKRYDGVPVFEGVSFDLRPGEFVALLGESGVGKSTLLNCIAGLDEPDAGTLEVLGEDLARLDADQRALLRRRHLGFVFQAFHVLPHLSVAQNVALPLLLLGESSAHETQSRVEALLAAVGMAGLGARWPAQLSGGQLQRVALARALAHRPRLLLADEPTGNLDPRHAAQVLALLREQVREAGAACLLVTHSLAAAAGADRVLRLAADGIRAEPPAA